MREETIAVGGAQLHAATWSGAGDIAPIVLLHDGLGSISQWGEVPEQVHARTGATVVAYDRAGHGSSTPVPVGPWPDDWLQREAAVLGELLDALGLSDPLLVGHSDGGSIALIHAARQGRCRAVVALAAHCWVERECLAAIEALRVEPRRFVFGLSAHHKSPQEIFEAWSGGWMSDEFSRWDIRPLVADIECPVLVAQGTNDEYATDAQLTGTVAAIGENAVLRRIDGAGHLLHRETPAVVVDLIATFHHEHVTDNQAGA